MSLWISEHTDSCAVITEEGRETLARAMFERQVTTFLDVSEPLLPYQIDLAWDVPGVRSFWRAEADYVCEVLRVG